MVGNLGIMTKSVSIRSSKMMYAQREPQSKREA
jgi:hypothetical protein